VDGVRAALQMYGENLAPVPRIRISCTGAVGPPAPPEPLHDAATHEGLTAQGPELLVKVVAAALDLVPVRCHI
jgi:hypothetical protein